MVIPPGQPEQTGRLRVLAARSPAQRATAETHAETHAEWIQAANIHTDAGTGKRGYK
jgi:hypothetical protein